MQTVFHIILQSPFFPLVSVSSATQDRVGFTFFFLKHFSGTLLCPSALIKLFPTAHLVYPKKENCPIPTLFSCRPSLLFFLRMTCWEKRPFPQGEAESSSGGNHSSDRVMFALSMTLPSHHQSIPDTVCEEFELTKKIICQESTCLKLFEILSTKISIPHYTFTN